jgi:putative membrane protein
MKPHLLVAALAVGAAPWVAAASASDDKGMNADPSMQGGAMGADPGMQGKDMNMDMNKAQEASAGAYSPERLLSEIHAIDQMEIRAGNMAKSQSSRRDVRAFGEMLAKDHTKNDEKARSLAKKMNAQLIEPQPMDDQERQRMQDDSNGMKQLESLQGAPFDQQYLSMMIAGHEHAIVMLTNAEPSLSKGPLRDFVHEMLPTLKEHKKKAEEIAKAALPRM